MLDQLFAKCSSLAHFTSVLGFIDQVATVMKGSFGGPLEQEVASIVCSLIETYAKLPVAPVVVVSPVVPVAQNPISAPIEVPVSPSTDL